VFLLSLELIAVKEEAVNNLIFPLSIQQRGLGISFPQGDSLDYGNQMMKLYTLTGVLEIEVLIKSVNAVVMKHEALRTRIKLVNGNACQMIESAHSFEMDVMDLSNFSDPDVEAERLVSMAVYSPFDLSNASPFRVLLLTLRKDHYVFALVLHHIMGDGWSMEIIIKEICEFYAGFIRGEEGVNKIPSIRYGNYSASQCDWISSKKWVDQLEYWRNKVRDAPALFRDLPCPTEMTAISAALSHDVLGAIKIICGRELITPFIFILAVYKLLLAQYSGELDICVTAPMTGRTRSAYWDVVGFFAGIGLLRTRLERLTDFRSTLALINKTCVAAYGRQDITLSWPEVKGRFPVIADFNFMDGSSDPEFIGSAKMHRYICPLPLVSHIDFVRKAMFYPGIFLVYERFGEETTLSFYNMIFDKENSQRFYSDFMVLPDWRDMIAHGEK
jgi:condensation domain-containing protein